MPVNQISTFGLYFCMSLILTQQLPVPTLLDLSSIGLPTIKTTEAADGSPGDKCVVKKGLTWTLARYHVNSGLYNVGCADCNPYTGDTICDTEIPILCIYKAKMPRPAYKIDCKASAMRAEYYCGWSGGFIKLTKPVKGCKLYSKQDADKICQDSFGLCWQMASHNDGYYIADMNEEAYTYCKWDWNTAKNGGWNFFAYGDIDKEKKQRFWVFTGDQPGNCWN